MRITLCMAVRDEASFVRGAIESALPVVDEAIVVDTGSTDGTPELAEAAGARVFRAPPPGDLGAVHALPLAHARGDWILSLDGDEVLDPAARDRLREIAAAGCHDGCTLPVRNYVYDWAGPKWRPVHGTDPHARGAAGYFPTEPVRLFRRRDGFVYSGRLHQSVRPAIEARGGTIGDAGVPVHHYGFLRFDRAKTDLYRRLARQQTLDEPKSPAAWIDLGVVLLEEGRFADAAASFRRARSLGDRAAASFFLGSALVGLEHPRASVRFLREAIANAPADGSPFYEPADAWEVLALAHEEAGRPGRAEQAYRSSLAVRPDSAAALNNLGALLVRRGAFDEAEELLGRMRGLYRGSGIAWATLGALFLRRGDLETARRTLETALGIRPDSLAVQSNLALAHARAGRRDDARRLRASVRERLGSREARLLGLNGGVRSIGGPVARRAPGRRDGLIVSLVSTLGGGGGRVLVDVVQALDTRPHVVACNEAFTHSGQGLRGELEAAGAEVVTVTSEDSIELLLSRLRPRVVVHHWWRQGLLNAPVRVRSEKWICIGHAPLPMPRGYDRYVVISEFHRRSQGHLPPGRVAEIPNGVALGSFLAARPRRANGRPVTIVMLSRLEPGKFPRRLLAQLPPLDDARLLIAGFGGRRLELEPEIAARGLDDRIRFVGTIPSAEVPAFLAEADIGLHLTDLHEELCSMAVLEMLAAGLPIVAEPKGALPEMIVDGRNGFLASDEREVADRLGRLVRSPELRRRLGAAGRRMARQYDLESFRSSWRALVDEVERAPLLPGPRRGGRLPPPRDLAYVVCATPRSGSAFLCGALGGTGVAGHPDDFFEPATVRTLAGRFGAADFGSYLAELYERTSTPNGVFGFKLTADHLPGLLAELPALVGAAEGDAELLAAAFGPLRYVHVTREDRVRQAVSWLRAEQSGRWADTGEPSPVAPPRPRFDRRRIERLLRELDAREAAWAQFFAAAAIEPVRVVYEELAADYEGTARRVLAELGIRVPRPLWLPPPLLRSQADDVTERWLERLAATAAR